MIAASATDGTPSPGPSSGPKPGPSSGRKPGRHQPLRRCVLCRTALPQVDLLRFVLGEGEYRFDDRRRLGGRGTWVCRPCATETVASDNDKRLRSALRGQALNMRELLEDALAAGPRRPSAITARQDGGMDVR